MSPTLSMLCLQPDMPALARWAAATGQRALSEDTGYALHAALRAALGVRAPKPFALVQRPGTLQLIGYTCDDPEKVHRALSMAPATDPGAAAALGLTAAPGDTIRLTPMPANWRAGEHLSFETRVAPVVRSRMAAGGAYPEIDAAFHPSFAGDEPGRRDTAHANWLAREIARGGAATVQALRPVAFQLTAIARRSQRGGNAPVRRETRSGLLPDLTVRGHLRIDDPAAFNALLARGLGRHRSFGFGCLLVAPPGAWT